MAVAKVIEITAESATSFDDAVKAGVAKASETVNNIKGAWVKEMKATVEGGEIVAYRVDLKITFVLE